ncbi:MAG TPA: gephyrin-like molybdotransferase Glp [Nitrolancea sp.]|nr:gephyrin-like molybdotransferase Glp [Nitrolancea sp.]
MTNGEPRLTRPAWDDPEAMLGVDEARLHIRAAFSPLAPVLLPILETLGLVLAEDVVSTEDIPPFRNSAMDGFAVRSIETAAATVGAPVRLVVRGEVAAGHARSLDVASGTAIRIMTGAVVPDSADAVIRFEEVIEHGGSAPGANIASAELEIVLSRPVQVWENVRHAGEDVSAGTLVLHAGTVVRPAHIALLAAMNRPSVAVVRRPVIAILSTGDEVVEIDARLEPGQIRNSNSYLLAAMTRQFGGEPVMIGIAADSEQDIQQHLRACDNADLLVTSGGVSMGDFDVVKRVLQNEGRIDLWQVRMKPGKPMAFGSIGETALLGLPGNPLAAAVAFTQFGRPAIRRMLGLPDGPPPTIRARLVADIENHGLRRHFVRGVVEKQEHEYVARPVSTSGPLAGLAEANGFIVIPENCGRVLRGALVDVELFDDGSTL